MKVLKAVTLIGLLVSGQAAYVQGGRGREAGFLSQFREYRRTTSAPDAERSAHSALNVAGLTRLTRHDFKSKRRVPGQGRTYLRFHLSVYEYRSAEEAASAFAALRSEVEHQQEQTPDKAPLYVLLDGAKVYWLGGACLYSRASWDAVEAKLRRALLGEAETGRDKALKILCGGALAG